MGRSVAVSIGVKNSGSLVALPGAITGAHDFAEWAEHNDFDKVILLTDENEPVDSKAIYDVIEDEVRRRGVDRLFIFFAGHGVSAGLDVDYWLLSPGPMDTAESAVNVAHTLHLARRSGIGHVAIFADHCRTAAGKQRVGILGRAILPDLDYRGQTQTEIDRFLAVKTGDPSQEASDPQLKRAFGIFTNELMTALNGEDPAATEIVRNGATRRAVTARSLRDWIVAAVQIATEKIPDAVLQTPDPLPGSYPPNVFAWLELSSEVTLTIKAKPGDPQPGRGRLFVSPNDTNRLELVTEDNLPFVHQVSVGSFCRIEVCAPLTHRQERASREVFRVTGDQTIEIGLEEDATRSDFIPDDPSGLTRTVGVDSTGATFDLAPRDGIFRIVTRDPLTGRAAATYRELEAGDPVLPTGNVATEPRAAREADHLAAVHGRETFETRVGLTLIGAKPEKVMAVPPDDGVFEEDGHWHVRGRGDSGSVVIDLGKGRFCATAMFEGYVGTVVIDDVGVSHIAYLPAGGSKFDVGAVAPNDVRRAMALATVSARNGRFDLAAENAADVAKTLRMYKHYNPMLGVFAAYAYDQAGFTDKICDMIPFFTGMGQTIPYDIVMLSGVDPTSIGDPIAPAFPMLTQGWAYLDPNRLSPAMAAARASLAPTLWATPLNDGGRMLAQALKRGDL